MGIPLNYGEAVKKFRIAADLGNHDAQYCLARCYIYGQGVSRDYSVALNWAQKAASDYPLADVIKRQLEQQKWLP